MTVVPTSYGSIIEHGDDDHQQHELQIDTNNVSDDKKSTNHSCHRILIISSIVSILFIVTSILYYGSSTSSSDHNNNDIHPKMHTSIWDSTSSNNGGGSIIVTKDISDTSTSSDNDNGTTNKNSTSMQEYFYHHQIIDHHHSDTTSGGTYIQRYYEKRDYFHGPGSPIFIILGGEDPLDGLLYPFIYDHVAKTYHGYTAALEHRFFGKSMPIVEPTHNEIHDLLTPNQALWDAVQFIQYIRKQLGCHIHRHHPEYCPVITVGGSYPGFLSSLMRMIHPDVVDIGYGSSAPFKLYSHHTYQYAYYDKITDTADVASPGCANAVRNTLNAANEDIIESLNEQLQDVAVTYGICRGSVPMYIQSTSILAQELMLIIATHFANGNMDYYPPTPEQDFVKGCQIFQNDILYPMVEQKIKAYLLMGSTDDCFDMMTELPPGPNGTISSSDWSGVGDGPEGYYWDFISCQLIPECGFSEESMFPPRAWNLSWVQDHCMKRFDWDPDPFALEREFGFDDLSHVTRLLLTNGIVDGWSISSVLDENVAPGVEVINMVNGAHHSDLSHVGPSPNDTPDVKAAFARITTIIGDWLEEVRN